MKNRSYVYLPLFFALVLILGIFIGSRIMPAFTNKKSIFSFGFNQYDKINDVINYVERDYVDSVSREGLIENSISGMLQSLDPHSAYIPAEDFHNVNDPLQGNFEGVGIQFRVIKDSIVVINTVPGGPSEAEGVKGGDRIIIIDGENVAGVKISDAVVMKKLKGPHKSKVKVTVYRPDARKTYDFSITRGVIPTWSVDIAYMATNDIGYIRFNRFSATTYDEVLNAMVRLKEQKMTKLILDLRGNGGGFFNAATDIADEFLPEGVTIVYTEGYHRKKEIFKATRKGLFEQNKMVVLIDGFSASASEILAGAIQDNDRGLIIGRRSFGKGLVQEQIQLSDGSAVRLTVSRYHTPSGRCIQKPYTGDTEAYYTEFYERLLDEGMIDSMDFVDTVKYYTLKGRVVYGGGGIMPDVYVSSKTETETDYYKKVNNKGLISQFAWEYADKNRRTINAYGSARNFITGFSIDSELMNAFVVFAEKGGVARNDVEIGLSNALIKAQLKGHIGRNIFNDAAYYPVVNKEDRIFQKAIEVLQKY